MDRPIEIVLRHIERDLEPAGYKRAGRTFRIRNAVADWGLINVQSSSKSTAQAQLVTVNLAVSLGIIRKFDSPTDDRIPHYSEGHWDSRIGHLLPERDDKWWTVASPMPDHEALEDIAGAVREIGVPTVAAHMSSIALRDLWITGPVPFLSNLRRLRQLLIVLAHNGPRDRFNEFAEILRGEAAGDEWWEAKAAATVDRLSAEIGREM